MTDHNARVARLAEAAQQRAEATHATAQRAITSLAARGQEISFTGVAREAGVSLSYLYKEEALAERIRELRQQQTRRKRVVDRDASPTERSLRTKLQAALDKLAELETENAQLKKENRALLSTVLDKA